MDSTVSQARAPMDAVTPALYPFEPHFHDVGHGLRMHYVDEGAGEPVVMVHGNPSWSFYYRNLAQKLAATHRVIVPDHIGCGFSDKPGDDRYDYTLSRRIEDLEGLLDALGLDENVTLVVHDWGGMIGMGAAVRRPERIKRIVLLNTAAFHLPQTKAMPLPLWLARDTKFGAMLVNRFNAFSRGAVRFAVKRPMSSEVAAAYVAPYDCPENRIATLRFVQDIPLKPGDRGYDLVTSVADGLEAFADLPILICWGLKDFVFDKHFLAVWREIYPKAKVVEFPEAGHYVLEDRRDEILDLVEKFVAENP